MKLQKKKIRKTNFYVINNACGLEEAVFVFYFWGVGKLIKVKFLRSLRS